MMSSSWHEVGGRRGKRERRKEGKKERHTSSWAAEHEYHCHLFFLKYGFSGVALSGSGSSSRRRRLTLALVDAREVDSISDLL